MTDIPQLVISTWFYSHALESLLIIGVAFTSIGFFFGFLMWRHYQFHVNRIVKTNDKMRDKIEVIKAHQQKLSSFVDMQDLEPHSDHS